MLITEVEKINVTETTLEEAAESTEEVAEAEEEVEAATDDV